MEQYLVSARKYRPSTFDTVIGQQPITVTLKNAIRSNHLAHAYLFCGPRGVGKTTCARIFAKTINCLAPTSDTEPCNTCESCKSFNEMRSLNIHELDAASNNSVDDIRTLIEKVRIPPQIGKYSVYIIDEVHMLSAAAFNAFLKTLEEPPHYAIFVLATTEKHKILPTILSRCQIYDFSRIKIEDTVNFLEKISQKENVSYDKEGLTIIAQKSEGAMRDALSIFDQIVSFSEGKVIYDRVINTLNILDYDYYFRLIDTFLKSDITASLLILDEIINKGFDLQNFLAGLSGHLRDLLVCKEPQTHALLEVGANIAEKYVLQTKQLPLDYLLDYMQIVSQCELSYRAARNQRLHLELALVQLCNYGLKRKQREQDIANMAKIQSEAKVQPQVEKAQVVSKSEPVAKSAPSQPAFTSTPSLKQMMSQVQSPKVNKAEVEQPTSTSAKQPESVRESTYNDDQLLEAGKNYADSIKVSRPRMYSALIESNALKVKDGKLFVCLLNNAQKEYFIKNIQSEMNHFLKNELKNDNVVLECEIQELDEENKKAYTPYEKLQAMKAKNPAIDNLVQNLKLDFE
jgi:DNA polymerase-3 subunit gamma/tau